ncbi:hypothetical protein O0550_17340 [Brevibacillus halotolerans]|uniref:hypothetical protein n=1 Tax=Brevibacillus TaxID=55080 RepID=UPI00215CB00D|nr:MULTISPECIES: hypothetical protein [Brevibacillus]MCR8964939.1 hypothetical protein [Brevibacillus laterosporus]MCZ0837094.1 hypothetical protein [Brevibacillus halotolerans]
MVVGEGYAGINDIKAIRKAFAEVNSYTLLLILIDKQPHHLRKVLLFKPAACMNYKRGTEFLWILP